MLPPRVGIPLRSRLGPAREPEMSLVRTFVQKGAICVDVGANKGTWTYAMWAAVGRQGRVIAVEPQRRLADYLEAGFGGKGNVEVRCCALSSERGQLLLRIPVDEGGPVRGHASLNDVSGPVIMESVQVETLDDLLEGSSPALVKIDVEGHELGVLQGGCAAIQGAQPTLIIEMMDESTAGTTAEAFDLLTKDLRYSSFYLESQTLVPLESWPPRQARSTPNVVFLKR